MTTSVGLGGASNWVSLLRHRAQSRPQFNGFTFLADGEDQEHFLTYGGLETLARTIGGNLQAQNFSGERALLLYPPGLDYIAGFFGCLFGGVTAVPAYPPDPNRLERTLPRLISIIQDSQAKVVLTTKAILAMAEFFGEQAPELKRLTWIATDDLGSQWQEHWQEPKLDENSLAFLQYTSGSTGEPKGVMLSHGNLLHNTSLINQGFGTQSEDVGVIWLPPYHDMGLIGGILAPLYIDMRVVLLSTLHFLQKPMRWLQAISKYRGNKSGGPNFAYELCLRKATPEQLQQLDLSSWNLAFTGAEPVLPQTLDRFVKTFGPVGFRKDAFYPCYGLAEGTLMVTGGAKSGEIKTLRLSKSKMVEQQMAAEASSEEDVYALVGCGQSFVGQQVRVVRPDLLTPCAEGEIGEILVQGPSVAQGYWNQEQLTQKTFGVRLSAEQGSNEGAFLRTGDLGFLAQGELYVTGRLKDMILIRGQNYYPQDIERTVEDCDPSCRPGCSAAFSILQDLQEQLVLVLEVDEKKLEASQQDFSFLEKTVRQAVVKYHDLTPYQVLFLKKGSIPKTSSGKIRRFACREEFLAGDLEILHASAVELEAFSNQSFSDQPMEKGDSEAIKSWLVGRIAELLNLEPGQVNPADPLSELALDSKDVVMLSGDLEDWLGRKLSPALLWKHPSIAKLSQYLGEEVR